MKSPQAFTMNCAAAITVTAADEGQPAKRPSFAINAYTGGLLRVWGFGRPVVIDLDGLRASKRTAVLLDHDPSQIVGQAIETKIDGSGVTLVGSVTGKDAASQKVVDHAADGFVWGASVGVSIDKFESVAEGVTVKVNGRQYSGPLYVVRAGRLGEVSFVAVGADENAAVKVAASAAKGANMNFEEWLTAKGFDAAALTDEQKATLQAAYDAETKPAENAPPATPQADEMVATVRAAMAAEETRIVSIRKVCGAEHGDIAARMIADGATAEAAELAVLRASRAKYNVRTTQTEDERGMHAGAVAASLLLAFGANPDRLAKAYGEKVMNAATSRAYRRVSLAAICAETLRAAGFQPSGPRLTDSDINLLAEAERRMITAGGFSTVSLTGILADVANKMMLDRFATFDSAVPQICYETQNPDFKPAKRYRFDSSGELKEVGADGELKHIDLVESSYTNEVGTRGGMLTLTRKDIINDDAGAFVQLVQIFAELAIHAREQALFTMLLANTGSFFGSDNGNYISGAATALSLVALDTGMQTFREQKGVGGRPLLLIPDRLLVPPALEGVARRLYASDMLLEAATAGSPKPATNTYARQFTPVISPYLASSYGLSGASDTAWYLLANRPGAAIAQVGYLQGRPIPTIEQSAAEFNKLGVSWRAYWDFGVSFFEPRAGVKSKGSA